MENYEWKYSITLADGTRIENLAMNGTNYVSAHRIDESIFNNNLSVMKISDGEIEEILTDMMFVQQMEWYDGMFYLAFTKMSPEDKVKTLEKELEDLKFAFVATGSFM